MRLPPLPSTLPRLDHRPGGSARPPRTCVSLCTDLTTDPNAEVGEVHPKAMPVILTKPEEWATWLSAPRFEAKELQQPLADGALIVVAQGERRDRWDLALPCVLGRPDGPRDPRSCFAARR
ncbi:SOS response-associated peptidase family protein [Methylobacterium sp. GC_Met_1]|uniref:SOS response-associated peptidase family protein n=1 Tax=unclassified Methylobacterium TaxID=2615210 RepID=UPI003211F06D